VYWQHVISVVCVLAKYQNYGMFTGSMSYVCFVYWQHVIGKLCVLAACHNCGVFIDSMS